MARRFYNIRIRTIKRKMITDKEGLKKLKEMNKHKCKKCGKIFINFKGMTEHRNKYKHHEFELLGSDLTLCYA